jgi:hypothetical protein
VLSILKEKKKVWPTVEKKKVQRHAPFGLAGKGQMPQAIQENALFSMGSFGCDCEACSSGVVVGYNTQESCHFS